MEIHLISHKDDQDKRENPVFMFFRAISIIENLSRARAEQAMPNDMKMSHFGVLNHLSGLDGSTTPARLANAFQVARPSMTNTIQKLESKKLIKVSSDPKDGRGKTVSITKKGQEERRIALQSIGPVFSDIVNELGPETFSSLLPEMKKIMAYLDENRVKKT